MKVIKFFSTCVLVSLLAACSSTPLSQQLTAEQKTQLTPVYQMTLKGSKVTFTVNSHGCTLPKHFQLKQNKIGNGKVELALLRLKQDWCRAMPRAYPVSFTLNDTVTEKQLVLLNQIVQSKPKKAKVNSKNINRK